MSKLKEHYHNEIEAGMRESQSPLPPFAKGDEPRTKSPLVKGGGDEGAGGFEKQHKIQWLNLPGYKGETWNPIIGCSKVSDGCKNCYAERMANRLASNPKTPWYQNVIEDGKWNGKTRLLGGHPVMPIIWKKPRLIFVCSMGDLFHENTSFSDIDKIFATMASCPQHIFIVLTKRAKRMASWFNWKDTSYMNKGMQGTERIRYLAWHIHGAEIKFENWQWPLPNVWIGVTAENQEQADKRIPLLRVIKAAVKFVSVEPMLGPVDLINLNNGRTDAFNPADAGINWVICGGESGHHARPVHPDWVRSLRNQCQAAGVPFFFKQWGEYKPLSTVDGQQILPFGKYDTETKFGFVKTGKHKSGNLLDGMKYEQYPIIQQ